MKLMVEGQMVEVDDSFDQMSAADQEKTVNEIAASMGIKSSQSTGPSETSPGGVATQLAAPAVTGAAYAAPTGLAKYGSDILDVAKAGAKNLAARPLMQTVGDVAGMATHGVPWGSIAKGAIDPASLNLGQAARGVMDVARAAPGYVAGMVGPALRGAARVAGPAGMAYNLAEAYPYLQQADIGNRVASGQIPQAMQTARQAPLNAPTPAPLSPQQAANLMASGDQRTIDIYGGAAKLAKTAQPAAPSAVTMPTGGLKAPSASQDPKTMTQYIALQRLLDSQRRQQGQ
jgi:hypothetical protein